MLKLNAVTISAQSHGTSWTVFLRGKQEDVEARFNSYWNHGASSGELENWTDDLWSFSAYPARVLKAMERAALFEILNTRNTKGTNPLPEARKIAKERFDAIEMVTYIRSGRDLGNLYSEGSPYAGKKGSEDAGDFSDVTTIALQNNRGEGQ